MGNRSRKKRGRFHQKTMRINVKNQYRPVLFAIVLLLLGCSQQPTHVVMPDEVGILVNDSDMTLADSTAVESGPIRVRRGQVLLVFKLTPDTLLFSTNVPSIDSGSQEITASIEYHLTKDAIIDLYRRFGSNFEEAFLEPESKAIIRGQVLNGSALTDSQVSAINDSLSYFFSSQLLIFKNFSQKM